MVEARTATRCIALPIALAFLASGCGDRASQPVTDTSAVPAAAPAAPASLAALRAQVGKYPRDVGLFESEPLHERLLALLGTRYTAFLLNFGTQGPLSEEGPVLYALGNKPHAGGDSAAILLIDVPRDLIHVHLLDEREMAEFRERDEPIELPADVQTTISNWQDLARDEP